MLLKEFYERIEGDYEGIIGRLRSEAMVIRFLNKFLEEKSYEELLLVAKENDVANAILAAHKLKGVTANLSFTKLCNLLTELLQDLRKENQDKVNEELLTKVKENYTLIVELIKEV